VLKLADLAVREEFSLGPLRVSPALRLITGPAGELHVEPLVMQVLLLLADANGQVVTRNRLYDECWGGVNVGDYSLNRAITMVRRIAAKAGPGAFMIESIPRTGYRLVVPGGPIPARRMRRFPIFVATAGISLAAISGTAWYLEIAIHKPAAAIIASDPRSSELVRGIKSSAMANTALYDASLRLLDEAGDDASADFIMKVRDSAVRAERRIDLNLADGSSRSLLWSWSGSAPETQAAMIEQEARNIAASVLTCAAETRDGNNRGPDQQTVKLYLDACSKFGPWSGADLKLLTDAFEQVTQKAPQMRGAWAKLFASKQEAIEGLPPIDLKESLRKDIGRAEALHINIPELDGAKAGLLAPNARFERLQLIEKALVRFPTSPTLLAARSWLLRSLGRMDEAAKTGQRLATLYPQSPAANTEYANSLMNSGRADAARNVLDRATRIAPDAANLRGSRWILEMRYGDPKAALALAQSGHSVVEEPMIAFLKARMNPTKANVDRAIDELMAGYREYPIEPGWVAQALGLFGRKEEAIRFLLAYPLGDQSGDGAEMLFRPHMHEIRRDRRFIQIAKNFGVTDYWIKSGILPDFCYEPDLPYDCKQQLAQLRG